MTDIDHEELLRKYIKVVGWYEGVDFTEHLSPVSGPGKEIGLTRDEIIELQRIAGWMEDE